MRMTGEASEEVADGTSAHEGDAGGDRTWDELERFVSPRLRQILAAAETASRGELLANGSDRRRNDPERLKAVLSEVLEELPGSFYPVYNAERERWELGIR